jgi:hypothetical protein
MEPQVIDAKRDGRGLLWVSCPFCRDADGKPRVHKHRTTGVQATNCLMNELPPELREHRAELAYNIREAPLYDRNCAA